MMSSFLAIERHINRALLYVAILLLAITATLVFYQVIMRFIVGEPSTWSGVASRTTMVWCVFLGMSCTFRSRAMLRVEAIYAFTPSRLHLPINTVIYLLCLTFLLLMVYLGCELGYRVRNQKLAGMQISIAWAYAALPVGSFIAIIGLTAAFIEELQERKADSVAKGTSAVGENAL